ncbi:hypothetical protein ABZV29_33550 [Streptomyces sp. NPDC005236]|uniref:hypothetical protein n=1 Tax=Streptomyces sp. NPDC005236 TaxID=3157028 RepID=UPI0033BB3FC5
MGAESHAAVFAGLPTGTIGYPGSAHQVVQAPAPRPGRSRTGWGVVAVTLVTGAVLAGGITAAAIWLTSDRSASPSDTARVKVDAVAPGTSAPPSVSASVAPTGAAAVPSVSGASPSASADSPEGIVRQVQGLLDENAPLLSRVRKAIAMAKDCSQGAGPVRDARDDLEAVAEAREGFARKIGPLTLQADGDLVEALDALSRGWTESAEADRAYSPWASDIVEFVTDDPVYGCGHGGAPGADYAVGTHNTEAAKAKQQFAELWNPIALRYGLTKVDYTHI